MIRKIKNLFKGKLLCLLLIISSIITCENYPIIAEEKNDPCYEETYYSKKQWVKHFDLFDTPFTNTTQMMNSQMVSVQLNGWGVYSFSQIGSAIWPLSSSNFSGSNPLVVKAESEYDDFYSTFYVLFNSAIRIDDFDIEVMIKDESGNLIDTVIYVSFTDEGLKEVYRGNGEERINIKLDSKQIDGIYVQAAQPANGNTYVLKYFAINSYYTYEHTEWVKDYIENTEVSKQQYCQASGNFTPYQGDEWATNYQTLFVPSIKLINDNVQYQQIGSWSRMNDGLNIGIKANSSPDYNTMYLWNGGDRYLGNNFGYNTSNKPFNWQRQVNAWSAYDNNSNEVYIKTNKTNGNRNVYLKVWADVIRCENKNCTWDWAGGGKKNGHGSTAAWNAFDTYVNIYTGEAIDNLAYISEIRFYLCDKQKNRINHLLAIKGDLVNDLEKQASELAIDADGEWIIEAELCNPLGDKAQTYSGVFKVDKTPPDISFTPDVVEGSNEKVNVTLNVNDDTSKIAKWRYAISTDGGLNYGNYTTWITSKNQIEVNLTEKGANMIKVDAIDNAGNCKSQTSNIYHIGAILPPSIMLKPNIYQVNQEVDAQRLKGNAIASDSNDGIINDRVVVEKISYENGTVQINPSKLDTSIAQKVEIFYSVTNRFGLKSSASKNYAIVLSDSTLIDQSSNPTIYVRYINKEHLNTILPESIWLMNNAYTDYLRQIVAADDVKQTIIVNE